MNSDSLLFVIQNRVCQLLTLFFCHRYFDIHSWNNNWEYPYQFIAHLNGWTLNFSKVLATAQHNVKMNADMISLIFSCNIILSLGTYKQFYGDASGHTVPLKELNMARFSG